MWIGCPYRKRSVSVASNDTIISESFLSRESESVRKVVVVTRFKICHLPEEIERHYENLYGNKWPFLSDIIFHNIVACTVIAMQ
jgi:hypothetical protein